MPASESVSWANSYHDYCMKSKTRHLEANSLESEPVIDQQSINHWAGGDVGKWNDGSHPAISGEVYIYIYHVVPFPRRS